MFCLFLFFNCVSIHFWLFCIKTKSKPSLDQVSLICRNVVKLPSCLSADVKAEPGVLFPLSHQIGPFSHSVCCPSLLPSDKKVLMFVKEIGRCFQCLTAQILSCQNVFILFNIFLPHPASLPPKAARLCSLSPLRSSGSFQSNDAVQQKCPFNHPFRWIQFLLYKEQLNKEETVDLL